MTSAHYPKKHLGQNFLTDSRILQRIVDACALSDQDIVVEIGPGQGVLTRLIAPRVKKLICVETDRDLIAALRLEFEGTHVEIIHADFLKWDMSILPQGIKVIGNIPYYISTPILEKLIEHSNQVAQVFLTVQLEFGQRLAAVAGNKEYGSLTCFAQYHADVRLLFKIKSSCFKPAPKVDSCFVALTMRPFPSQPHDEQLMFKLIRQAFTQRRKTTMNALSTLIEKEKLAAILTKLNIPLQARPETLTLHNYVDITNTLVI